MPQDTETLTAYHEAGHAIMAVSYGGRVIHVSIDPPDDDGLKRFGESIVQWPPAAVKDVEIAELKVSLAGPIAELIYDGSRAAIAECGEFAADWQQAVVAASRLKPERGRDKFLAKMERQVWSFFEDQNVWAATCAVADQLLAHETIEHEQVADAWAFWQQR